MSLKTLHQFAETAIKGDATTDQALLIRHWLRKMGLKSELFTEHIQPGMEQESRRAASYRPSADGRYAIYHHAIGADVVERILSLDVKLILIYHNITPPEFFANIDPGLTKQLIKGRDQLRQMRDRTVLALGDSDYNQQELIELGFANTGTLPIVLNEEQYQFPLDEGVVARFKGQGPLLLFVGRITPNKRQEDLVKLLAFYRRFEPNAKLILVGSAHQPEYQTWLQEFADDLGVGDGLFITGHVSQQEMITYYQIADLFVSMSEHEGFGKPLIESMYFKLPVLAYASTAVPFTMGEAGILFHHKDYEALAEVADKMIRDTALRQRIIETQSQRLQSFLSAHVEQEWHHFVAQIQQLSTT